MPSTPFAVTDPFDTDALRPVVYVALAVVANGLRRTLDAVADLVTATIPEDRAPSPSPGDSA